MAGGEGACADEAAANLCLNRADGFHRDPPRDLKTGRVLANPPFNGNDRGGELLNEDKCWVFGTQPDETFAGTLSTFATQGLQA